MNHNIHFFQFLADNKVDFKSIDGYEEDTYYFRDNLANSYLQLNMTGFKDHPDSEYNDFCHKKEANYEVNPDLLELFLSEGLKVSFSSIKSYMQAHQEDTVEKAAIIKVLKKHCGSSFLFKSTHEEHLHRLLDICIPLINLPMEIILQIIEKSYCLEYGEDMLPFFPTRFALTNIVRIFKNSLA